jgi:Ca2+-binding RTX toxin-like protein
MLRLALTALTLLLLLPAAAHAGGTMSVQGDTLVFTGTDADDGAVIGVLSTTGEFMTAPRGSTAIGPTTAGPGCRTEEQPGSGGQMRIVCPSAGVTKVSMSMGAGDDQVTATFLQGSVQRTVDMGAGDDRYDDSTGGVTLALGAGDDTARVGGSQPVTVSAGDGADDVFCGNNAAGNFRGKRAIDGGDGNDELCGGRGNDVIDGGAGDDKIDGGKGSDTLDGEAGDDLLEGGEDSDRITGGRGEDEIDSGSGKDDIRARDRDRDDVGCGSGRDKVSADRTDDLVRCETISRR